MSCRGVLQKMETTAISELTFQLIVESSPNAIVLVGQDGNVLYLNRQMEKLFGYNRSELVGQQIECLIPPRLKAHHPALRGAFFTNPSVRAMGAGRELYALRKDHTEFPIEIGLNPIEAGGETYVIASIIDITERKKAEERFRLVVESAPNAMVLINQSGAITLINRQVETLFGYSRDELIGAKIEMLIPERFKKQHPQQRGFFFEHPKARAMGAGRELFALRKDGSEVQVEIGLNPIETIDAQMVLASIIDITERKIQEATLLKKAELEVRNKELEQFAYLASHDLQEPLRTVANYMQLFEEDYGAILDDEGKRYLKAVSSATLRMGILIKALLEYARLGSNTKLKYVDCADILNHVLADMHSTISATQAIISIGPMPKLYVYEIEMYQLFQNLISNSLKFRRSQVIPEIKIEARELPGKWQFSITDNGIGIESKDFEKIFQIFQRLHTKQEFDGHGVGLANCKKIVQLHQGEIWVGSSPGVGSTFFFTIPA